jgi:hypothetical protein
VDYPLVKATTGIHQRFSFCIRGASIIFAVRVHCFRAWQRALECQGSGDGIALCGDARRPGPRPIVLQFINVLAALVKFRMGSSILLHQAAMVIGDASLVQHTAGYTGS